jgi:hypothetical protein
MAGVADASPLAISRGLATAVDGVHGCGPGGRADGDTQADVAQVASRSGEFQFVGLLRRFFEACRNSAQVA